MNEKRLINKLYILFSLIRGKLSLADSILKSILIVKILSKSNMFLSMSNDANLFPKTILWMMVSPEPHNLCTLMPTEKWLSKY